MRRSSIAAVLAAAAVGVGASEARAQYWLADRQLTQGRGIRVGDFELHPGVGAEFGFDSNAFYSTNADPALRLRVTGNIGISTLGPQRSQTPGATQAPPRALNFRANLGVSYSHFFGLNPTTAAGRPVSDASNLGFSASVAVAATPNSVWSFSFSDTFARAVQGTSELNFGQLFVFNRWQNTAQLGLGITPGGGSFEFRATYTNNLNIFFSPGFEGYNNMANEIGLQMRWRFLPKTSIAWSGTASPSFYFNPTTIGTGLFTSVPLTTRLGITGLFTERVAFQLFGGYQATYFSLGDNVETFVGNAEVRFITGPQMSVRVGVLRDIAASLIGNYMVRNNLYVSVSHSFGGRFLLSGEAQGGLVQFGYLTDQSGRVLNSISGAAVDPNTRRLMGFRVLTMLFGEYRFTDYLGLNATLAFTGNLIDAQISSMGMAVGSLNWIKFEAFLGLRVNW
jgi:hypothetical protein